MRHSEWFGRILKNKNQKFLADSDKGAQIGLYREYRGKLYLLPFGKIMIEKIINLFEARWPFLPSLTLPAAGSRLDWAAVLAGEIKSYTELPVWIKVLGGRNWFDGEGNGDLQKPDLSERYVCVDENNAVLEAEEWKLSVENLLSVLNLKDVRMTDTLEYREWFLEEKNAADHLLSCQKCGWLGRGEYHPVNFISELAEVDSELPIMQTETPGVMTIEALASFFGVTAQDTMKSVFLETDEGLLIHVLIRGDREVSREKVAKLLDVHGVRVASQQSLQRIGASAGYAGPVMKNEFRPDKTVLDLSITTKKNYIAGANKMGWHLMNVRPGRDFEINLQGDITEAVENDACAYCGSQLKSLSGRILASWKPSTDMFSLSGSEGKRIQIGLGLGTMNMVEILTVLAGHSYRENCMQWPDSVAPFNLYLISIRKDETAEKLYRDLLHAGVTIFYDDRDVSPGVKFNDADLMGCPFRITVSSRSIEKGGVEVVNGRANKEQILSLDRVVEWMCSNK